ncbi:MAG: hypothetical protein WCJ35_17795 [Planctomycetota bacterium]
MDHLSARRQRLWEAMESCRNGSDLSDPLFADLAAQLAEDSELRVQFRRLQQADGAIKAAFANVPVPAGLADRVSRRLAELVPTTASDCPSADCFEAPTVTMHTVTVPAAVTTDWPTPLQKSTERFSRRRLLVGFTAISAAAVLLAAVWIQTHPPRHDTPNVLEEALDFFGKDNQPFGEFVSRVAPPVGYPISRDIVRLQDIRWRHVEEFLGGPAVAYDLPTIGGRATLYVLQRNIPGLPSIPPSMPSLSTGGMSAAAWQAGDTLYVLVVEGDAGMYSRCLEPHGPVA